MSERYSAISTHSGGSRTYKKIVLHRKLERDAVMVSSSIVEELDCPSPTDRRIWLPR